MARKCLMLGILLQGLSVAAMDKELHSNELRKSKDSLRRSTESVSSGKLKEEAAKAIVASMYYDSPCCGQGVVVGYYNVSSSMKPLPSSLDGCFFP